MLCFTCCLQKLLLLPELSNNTITYSDPVNSTSTPCSPNVMSPLKLVNNEVTTNSGHGSLSNGATPRITVSNLIASWTNVSHYAYKNLIFKPL